MNGYFEQIGAWPANPKRIARTYALGFALSLALTVLAYMLAVQHALPQQALIIVLVGLALVQFGVQLVCFLHLDHRASPERLIVLGGACLVVLILVSGSIWIMFTLNGRMMPNAAQMEQYMNDQGGF